MKTTKLSPDAFRNKAIRFYDMRYVQKRIFRDVATGIVNMGKAHGTNKATAMVAVPLTSDTAQDFTLYLNADELKDMTREQVAGVVWHELNHILLGHLHYRIGGSETMPNEKMRIIAEEICCNDTVLYHNVDLPYMYTDNMQGIYYGEKWLGYNTYERKMSTQEVYDALMAKAQEHMASKEDSAGNDESMKNTTTSGGSGGDSSQNANSSAGNTNSGASQQDETTSGEKQGDSSQDGESSQSDNTSEGGNPSDGGGNSSECSDLENSIRDELARIASGEDPETKGHMDVIYVEDGVTQDALDSIMADVSDGLSPKISGGNGVSASAQNQGNTFMEMTGTPTQSIDFTSLMRKINPHAADAMSGSVGLMHMARQWSRKPRWSHGLSRDNTPILPRMVPSYDESNGSDASARIVFAVDVSGSIPEEIREKTRLIVSTIPKNMVDVKVVYFAKNAAEVDISSGEILNKEVQLGYGTEFSSIVEWMRENYTEDKTSVVVLTDGLSSFKMDSLPLYPDDWYWVGTAEENRSDFYNTLCNSLGSSFYREVLEENTFMLKDILK